MSIDKTIRFIKQQQLVPDILHGHYPDAGYVAAMLAELFGVSMVYTGHSLGRSKLERLLFEAASALGSVGLSSGVTRPEMPAVAKGGLAFLMWIGRLEIISAVMLFTAPLRGGGHREKGSTDKDERRGHHHHAE